MILKIKVKTKQPKTEVIEKGDIWKVHVKGVPENNKANQEIIKFFTKYFKKEVQIISGKKSSLKVLKIQD